MARDGLAGVGVVDAEGAGDNRELTADGRARVELLLGRAGGDGADDRIHEHSKVELRTRVDRRRGSGVGVDVRDRRDHEGGSGGVELRARVELLGRVGDAEVGGLLDDVGGDDGRLAGVELLNDQLGILPELLTRIKRLEGRGIRRRRIRGLTGRETKGHHNSGGQTTSETIGGVHDASI